ncbi:MAG: DUF2332 domain-containing protein [Rhodospirillales bacterium]
MQMGDRDQIAALYRRFAVREARGISPLYESFALAVAREPALLDRLDSLPQGKAQPNLLFAALRHLKGLPRDTDHFLALAQDHWDDVASVMRRRSTQTNEPGRCATLLPLLAALPQPLALLEVGASAGLCLLPDRYGYRYLLEGAEHSVLPPNATQDTPVFPCRVGHGTPLPDGLPRIAWRAGLDLNPLDLRDPAQCAWLETLVWPEQAARAERLRAAIALARLDPPRVVRGDLNRDLAGLAAEVPPEATLVVFHSAVLAYLQPDARARFREAVRSLPAIWICNEAASIFPDLTAGLGQDTDDGRFVLLEDGGARGFAGPHGQTLDWL